MSGRLIGYPTGWTLAVFDEAHGAQAARSELEASAIDPNDLHFVNRFGAWATEEIAPWRGEMPKLPQYMQR
jgi:hypothetical protein